MVSTNLPLCDEVSCDIKRITKEWAVQFNSKFEKPKKRGKTENSPKKALSIKGVVRDVTRDSVIITRDLAVIRNHTDCKSQGHITVNVTQRQGES